MKRIIFLLIMCNLFSITVIRAQDSLQTNDWKFGAQADFYFIESFFVIPMISADKNKLHLEARYLNEEVETFSGWIGYNISGGNEFSYLIIPMAGATIGRMNGFATELDLTLNLSDFEFYNQLEYIFDFDDNDVFYFSLDLSYSPLDWMWFGISGRRVRIFQKALDLERGLFVGLSYKYFQINTYLFNVGSEDSFLMLSLAADF